MPKNKRDINREEKLKEIIDNAHQQFLENGYESASMVQIAKAAGVASNTIYWYFKNKDELFACVINKVVSDAIEKISQKKADSLSDLLKESFNEWKKYRAWTLTVHQRLGQSTALRAIHDSFHHTVEGFMFSLLSDKGVPQDLAGPLIRIGRYAFEGILLHIEEDRLILNDIEAILKRISESDLGTSFF